MSWFALEYDGSFLLVLNWLIGPGPVRNTNVGTPGLSGSSAIRGSSNGRILWSAGTARGLLNRWTQSFLAVQD
jgi:hypothetical protein